MRGRLDPETKPRRIRSTRRRQDAPNLPRRPSNGSTVGRVYTDERTGKEFRPSEFITLTLPSYGPVREDDSMPINPATYDYDRAARDALHFGKLVDRWVQNLRRVAEYDLQYFAVVEPQKRSAPHLHIAIRGTLPREVIRQVTAATYAQVWWPSTTQVRYPEYAEPVWDACVDNVTDDDPDAAPGGFVDRVTAELLPTWEQALDTLAADPAARPRHVARFGTRMDVQGVLAGTPAAERLIGYAVKYLTADLGTDLVTGPTKHNPEEADGEGAGELALADVKAAQARRADHVARLVEALRYEPCSPSCPNWLRYGIQPKNPKPIMRAGCCKAKAHKATHLGYGGRRVLVSRKWTAKDLADHRHDRKAHVLAILGRNPDGTPIDSDDGDSADGAGQCSAIATPTPTTRTGPADGNHLAWQFAAPLTPTSTRYLAVSCATSPTPADGAPNTAPLATSTPLVRRPAPRPPTSTPLPEEEAMPARDPLLTIDQAAELLGTGPRFPRRLIAERRIRFVHVGRHVRIPESALIEYVVANTIEPTPPRRRRGRAA